MQPMRTCKRIAASALLLAALTTAAAGFAATGSAPGEPVRHDRPVAAASSSVTADFTCPPYTRCRDSSWGG